MPPTTNNLHTPDQRHIYLSAPYPRRNELIRYTEELKAQGHRITSNWVYGDEDLVPLEHRQLWTTDIGTDDDVDPHAQPIAIQDYEELKQANTLIFFSQKPSNPAPRGSRHVEFGMAYSLGLQIFVIGPRENLFHTMPEIRHWDSWEQFQATGPCFPSGDTTG